MGLDYNFAFVRLGNILPYLHVIFVCLFVGFQASYFIGMRLFLGEYFAKRDEIFSQFLRSFKIFIITLSVLLGLIAVSGYFMVSFDGSSRMQDPFASAILATMYALFCFLGINIFYLYYKYLQCLKNGENLNNESEKTQEFLIVIRYFLPLNFAISLGSIYLGVAYGGF